MLGTVGTWGLELSPKGDHPGFVEVVDDRTLLIPERKGNQFALSLANILAEPRVGILMIRPATHEVLRISGRATLIDDEDVCARLSAGGRPAKLAIRVDVDRAAFHCVRSAKRAGLWIRRPGTSRPASRSAGSTPRPSPDRRSRRSSTTSPSRATRRCTEPGGIARVLVRLSVAARSAAREDTA